ncbi:MAG: DUF3040 domain-containing protein [Actinomycetota bacterium]
MTLSDRENQILQDIEARLYEQDPKFAQEVASTTLQSHLVRNIRRGIAMFLAGLAVLFAFFLWPTPLIGVVAFLLMLMAATYTYQNLRKAGSEQMKTLRQQAPLTNLVGRLEERLRELRHRRDS